MQHTDKYKFNLIETSDTFSPDALNENARTAEAELARVEAETAAADAALAGDIAALAADTAAKLGSGGKNARIEYGTYKGDGQYGKDHPNTLTFDFKPYLVFISVNSSYLIMLRESTRSISYSSVYRSVLSWEENSVSWYSGESHSYQCNSNSTTYYYIAVGESF